ncbi:uncharacterized protein N7483_011977 [Penicillium malachiteum]|uniref:uncharacterized protein n=1 Tax=Penicillium malachiteum TaxID=1324776 RepID=UPI0025479BD8|nr:uncharacterized protein N7483_011977 [Penicillium malachiteum]KAJ5714796.1 hypothetical protein N7483_011977 [Penicillium malachiteum]
MAASRQLPVSPVRPSIRLFPAHSRENSRSGSPDRSRGSLFSKIDPLLSNLSPESTLQALTSTEAVPSDGKFSHDVLSQSISQVSPAERAMGIRAAIAARNLDLWYKEVKTWRWPKMIDARAGMGFLPPDHSFQNDEPVDSSLSTSSDDVEYYGSLPAELVQEYEKRIDEIRDGIESLDMEELKEHVLNAHIPSRSRPSSSTSTTSVPPPLSYVQLKDFTAIVTATILRALPGLSRLISLLSTWDVRLLVCRQIPGLLRELKASRFLLDNARRVLESTKNVEDFESRISNSFISNDHVRIEAKILGAGARLDRILDALGSSEDTVPDQWVVDVDALEPDFGDYVAEAHRYKDHTRYLSTEYQSKMAKAMRELRIQDSENNTNTSTSSDSVHAPPIGAMETIEEEPRPESQPAPPIESPVQGQSNPDSLNTDSGLPTNPEPEISQNPSVSNPSLGKNTEKNLADGPEITVAEDLPTLEQPEFPQELSVEEPEVQSPACVSLSAPHIENKENIPPEGFVAQRSPSIRESTAKPVVLAEHMDDDLFFQKPSTHRELESKPEPNAVVVIDIPTDEDMQPIPREGPRTVPADEPKIASTDGACDSCFEREPFSTEQKPYCLAAPEDVEKQTIKTPSTMAQSSLDTVASGPSPKPSAQESEHEPHNSIIPEAQFHQPAPRPSSADKPMTAKQDGPKKKPLQSPIKLSKSRIGRLSLDKNQKSRSRRPSMGSVGSIISEDSMLASPAEPGAPTGSSNEITPPHRPEFKKSISRGEYMLREDRLRRLENLKISARSSQFQETRSVSLPLQRFINEKLDLDLNSEPVPEIPEQFKSMKQSTIARVSDIPIPTPKSPRMPKRRPALTRGKSASDLKKVDTTSNPPARDLPTFGGNTARRAMQHQDQPKSFSLRRRLTAHPSLEGLGLRRQELAYVEEDESERLDSGSRPSSPHRQLKKPRDQLDEKINTILSTLPGRIHLVDPNNEADTSSSSSSLDRKMRERYLSESPHGPTSRSITPAPSLTLMPATRRRLSHAHKTEDSYVKLYHLHHGGQTAPTKLFVRTVGEEGQRVMVRVGGGWADLGEYLREYVIHHGRRKVSETPRVEVQGLASRSSPGHSPGSNLLTPAAPYIPSGRATPSRPPSVLGARPSSSLTVRKTRRSSTASEAVTSRSVTTGALSSFTSPPSAGLSRNRRLSMSSSYSFAGDVLSPPLPSHEKVPLGLAGPKPRSRQISMSPEGEAWVENVLQKTRRSTSFNPLPFGLNTSPKANDSEHPDTYEDDIYTHGRSLPKVRSVNDIRSVGSSRRVSLRGLGNHR